MTVSSTTNKWTYTGDGGTSEYDYTKKIFAQTDLEVIVADTDGDETTLTLTTDYTVAGVGEESGGSITLVNASQAWLTGGFLTTNYVITIKRVRPLKQETDIRNQGAGYKEAIENEFDKQIMIDQQQQEEIDRSIKLPISNTTTTSTEVGAPVNDAYLGYNSDSTQIVSKVPTSLSDSGPNINGGDAGKIIRVNSGESAYELATFKAILEAVTSGGFTFNTDLTIASEMAMSSKIFKTAKGADVASAGALTLGDDGNFFDITGTTNITSITAKTAGTMVTLQFDGILTVTDGSNLKIRGDFVTYAEATMVLICDGTNWFELSRSVSAEELVQPSVAQIWTGAISAIPSGYVICDGNNGTPDLTDRFVIHADADAAGTNNVGDTGGASTITLTESEMPSHTHTDAMYNANGWGSGDNVQASNATSPAGSLTTDSTGGDGAHSNRDKYYALAYIMKT